MASTSSSCWPQKDIKKKKKTTRMTDEERDRIFGQRFCETKKDITEDDVFGSPVFKNNIDK